jgi:hypothetical protein
MICFGNEKIMEKLRNRCLIIINLGVLEGGGLWKFGFYLLSD